MRDLIKFLTPNALINFRRKLFLMRRRRLNEKRDAKDVFTDIYVNNKWGGVPGEFSSGSGSGGVVAKAYSKYVTRFIAEHDISVVVDIGCGDFRIGREISNAVATYIGIDVVEELINHNERNYGTNNIKFICLDAAKEDLPKGDLCLVRQVFQHLSNEQIRAILRKLVGFRYVMVTEHYPAQSNIRPNLDKSHGADIRVYDNSAVVLDLPPFNIKPLEKVLDIKADDFLVEEGETIKTFLFSGAACSEVVAAIR